jgi:hypothetical protein
VLHHSAQGVEDRCTDPHYGTKGGKRYVKGRCYGVGIAGIPSAADRAA